MSTLILFLALLGVMAGLIALIVKKDVSGLKLMLLGLNITLFGGILVVDSTTDLGGIEYLIALVGLIISVVGIVFKE